MRFPDRMVGAVNSALHQAETTLCRVGMDVAANVFIFAVVDRLTSSKLFAGVIVLAAFVSPER